MKTEIIEYTIPSYLLSTICNGDTSGLDDNEIEQWEQFETSEIEGWRDQFPTLSHWHWSHDNETGDSCFYKWHDMTPYGVLACDCEKLQLVLFYE